MLVKLWNKFVELLDGNKTYIVALLMILLGVSTSDQTLILEGFGLITLRLGIKKVQL